MNADGAVSQDLLSRIRRGESAAAGELVDVYAQRLLTLARSNVGPRYRRRFDPEDVVQSALGVFFEMTRSDDVALRGQGDLWYLLAALTMNKLRNRIHHNRAAKRTVTDEESYRGPRLDPPDPDPGPEDLAVLEDEIRSIRYSLPPEYHYVFDSLLAGRSPAEIAENTGDSERTVQRVAVEVRQKLEARLGVRPEGPIGEDD